MCLFDFAAGQRTRSFVGRPSRLRRAGGTPAAHVVFERFLSYITVAVACLLTAVGCQSRVKPPSVDPEEAAATAIENYDTDGDGSLNEAELAACPGLLVVMDRFDTTGDRQLSQDEIEARLGEMYSGRVGLTTTSCKVTLDRRPLAGAKVRYVPEAFLGSEIKAAEGVTDQAGFTKVAIPDEQLPEDQRGIGVLQMGVYRVEITHPTRSIPAKYNTRTTLGCELHPTVNDEPPIFHLQSK